jgi:hypothetical protein
MPDPELLRHRVRERLAEQRGLIGTLLRLREQLRGSLFLRYGECGKEGCACRTGRKHGPYYVLSLRTGDKGTFAYLTPEQLARARDLVARHREFRAGLRRVRRLNLELLALLRRYQEAASRRAGRRLGLTQAR